MITTFYSFKGGVGRSFALLESAAQLARRGHAVLVWDLDLEAPGIQRLPALQPLEDCVKGGTLDLLRMFQEHEYAIAPVHEALPGLIVDLPHDAIAQAGGRLSFLLPGVLDDEYPARFAGIDWKRLFAPEVGPGSAFFSDIAHRLIRELGYEHVVVDSRTGYTELGAVCTFELPDLVVLVFNLNAQNVAGVAPVWTAVTQTRSRFGECIPVFAVANMVPELDHATTRACVGRTELKKQGLEPHLTVKLHPARLLTDIVPSLDGAEPEAEEWRPVADRIEARAAEFTRVLDRDQEEKRQRRGGFRPATADGEPYASRLRRGVYDRAKSFEEKVADLFRLLGYDATVDYKRDDMQFDVRLEMPSAAIASYALVECKDTERPVTQKDVREFASKVDYARGKDECPYQAILVARSAFANNAHAVAKTLLVQLRTYDELLRSLADLSACIESALRDFQGSALERMYVEQDALFDEELQNHPPTRHPLTPAVEAWLERPGDTFLALLGDFGTGKTSFARRLACLLAAKAKEQPGTARVPVLVDLREARSTTVSLENILTHRFQSLSSRPFNPQALLHLNREGHLVLVFDGFDEMLGYSDPAQFAETLRQILRAADGRAKVILTCRTHYFRDRPEALKSLSRPPAVVSTPGATQLWEELQGRSGTRVIYLCDFTDAQIEAYLQRALPPPADWRAFREEIRRTYNLEDLAERPFLLDLIVKTLPNLRAREGAGQVTIADLYEAYCEQWFRHTDFRLTLVREQKVALVEYLARFVWDSPDRHAHYEVLADKAREFYRDRPLTPFEKEKIDYEVRTALFLNRNPEGYYSFIHRSFLEFFVARTLRAALKAGNADALDTKRLTREVAFFLEAWDEAHRIPDVCRAVLIAPYRPRVSENALLLLYWHAYARLAPLIGGREDRGETLGVGNELRHLWNSWSVDPATFRLEGADLSGVHLPHVQLDGARLESADLSHAMVRRGSFKSANMARACLAFADAQRAIFENADLSGADLNHMDARMVNLGILAPVNLAGANLTFAALREATVVGADLAGTRFAGAGLLRAKGSLSAKTLGSFAGRPSTRERELDLSIQIGHLSIVTCVAWSPSGCVVASGSDDKTVKLWDVATGRVLRTLAGHTDQITSLSWDASGERLASGSDDHTVKVWDAATGRELQTFEGHASGIKSVCWGTSGKRLATGSSDATVKLWDAASGRVLRSLEGHTNWVLSVCWDASEEIVASGSDDKKVKLWEAATGRVLGTMEGHTAGVKSVAWDPNGKLLASGSDDATVVLWDTGSRQAVRRLAGHETGVWSVAWDSRGERLASGASDHTVKLWEARTGRLLRALHGHTSAVWSVSFDPADGRVVSGSADRSVRLWDAATGLLLRTLGSHDNEVFTVSWNRSGSYLAAGYHDGTLRLWDAATGRVLRALEGHTNRVWSVSWDAKGERLASGSWDHTVKLWDVANGELLRTLEGHAKWVWCVSWDASGERLASGSDRTVRVWDAANGQLLRTLDGHTNAVRSVSWDVRGERLASGSLDKTVRLWDVANGQLLRTLESHAGVVASVAWDTRGAWLASGSSDRTVKLWDGASGRLLRTLEGHADGVVCIAWDLRNERLASGSNDNTVKLWDASNGRLLRTLKGHSNGVLSVAWDPCCERLVVGCGDGSLCIWNIAADPPCVLVRLYGLREGRNLAVTGDGLVSGTDEQALDIVRFADRWALYDVSDVPTRVIPFEQIAERLRRPGAAAPTPSASRASRPARAGPQTRVRKPARRTGS